MMSDRQTIGIVVRETYVLSGKLDPEIREALLALNPVSTLGPELADAISKANPDFEVEYRESRFWSRSGGPPAVERLSIDVGAVLSAVPRGVDVATNDVVDRVVEAAISCVRRALRREKDDRQEDARPKSVVIYGPYGEWIRSFLMTDPDSDPDFLTHGDLVWREREEHVLRLLDEGLTYTEMSANSGGVISADEFQGVGERAIERRTNPKQQP
jgi:hypothetical protein